MLNTTWTSPTLFNTACAVLVIYGISLPAIAYIFYKHKKSALQPWLQLTIFVTLQLAGYGIIAGAGQLRPPPYIAPIIASVGLSPLMVGTAAVLHQWFSTTRVANFEKNQFTAQWLLNAFHLIGIFAFGQIVSGELLLGEVGGPPYARPLLQAGAFLLTILYLTLCFATLKLWWHHSKGSASWLVWSVLLALPFLGLRHIYEVITAWDGNADLNQTFGKLTYRVALQILPQTAVLLFLIVGAVLARNGEDARLGLHEPIDEHHVGGQRDHATDEEMGSKQ